MYFAFLFYAPDPILWQWGFLSIRWYGAIVAIAVLVGIKLTQFLAKYQAIKPTLIGYLASCLIVSSLMGARLFYLLFYHQTSVNWFNIQGGGLSIYGALLGGCLATFLFSRYTHIPFGKLGDLIVPSLPIIQAIALWGHFFNNEAFGLPTNVPWRLYIPISQRPDAFLKYQYFHPTFLYESLFNLLIFMILIWLFCRKVKSSNPHSDGKISFIYLILFSLTKFIIEPLQINHLMLGSLKIYLMINFLILMIGIMGLIFFQVSSHTNEIN